MFERKRIKSIAEKKLGRGIPKNVIEQELQSEFADNHLIRKILQFIPTKESKEKYGKYNSFLFLGLIIVFLVDIIFLDFYSFPLIIIDLILIWLVGTYNLRWYRLVFLRVLGAIAILVISHLGYSLKYSHSFYWVMLLISILLLFYSLFFAKKLMGNGE